jgi:hypothetical protein
MMVESQHVLLLFGTAHNHPPDSAHMSRQRLPIPIINRSLGMRNGVLTSQIASPDFPSVKQSHLFFSPWSVGLCLVHDEQLNFGVNCSNINGIYYISLRGCVMFDVTEVLMSCFASVMGDDVRRNRIYAHVIGIFYSLIGSHWSMGHP